MKTGLDLPETVLFADYKVSYQIGVRAPVRELARALQIGGTVQRISAEQVRICAATADRQAMISFIAQVRNLYPAGSVQQTDVIHSSTDEHRSLSIRAFKSIWSSFQHKSGNDHSDITSRSSASRGMGGPGAASTCG